MDIEKKSLIYLIIKDLLIKKEMKNFRLSLEIIHC